MLLEKIHQNETMLTAPDPESFLDDAADIFTSSS